MTVTFNKYLWRIEEVKEDTVKLRAIDSTKFMYVPKFWLKEEDIVKEEK